MYSQKDLDVFSFFRDDPTYQKIIQGFYGLNYLEFVVFSCVHQIEGGSVTEIIEATANGWPRNKLNRALKRLCDLGLCKREREGIPNGGFQYFYTPKSLDMLKEEIFSSIEEWLELVKIELEDLANHVESFDITAYGKEKAKRERIREEWFDN